jgi:hypothetical protein
VLCGSANFLASGSQKWDFTMAKGPIEAVEARLRNLEARVGKPVRRRRDRPLQPGELGPGGRWLQERLDPKHPESLDRLEQDLLGRVLLAYDRQDFHQAQELLDQLHNRHKLRTARERCI